MKRGDLDRMRVHGDLHTAVQWLLPAKEQPSLYSKRHREPAHLGLALTLIMSGIQRVSSVLQAAPRPPGAGA